MSVIITTKPGSNVTPGANTALSNLASVAINTSLLPGTTNSIALGSPTLFFTNIYANALADSAGNPELTWSTTGVEVVNTLGVGFAAQNNIAVFAGNSSLAAGTNQQGFNSSVTFSATSSINNFISSPTIAASTSLTNLMHFQVLDASKGSGASISTQYGLLINPLAAATSNIGISIGGANTGAIQMSGQTSGNIIVQVPSTITSYSMTLPSAQGTGALTNNGSGVLSWSSTGSYKAPTVQMFTSTGTQTGLVWTISTSTTCAVGDTYTNNGNTYTVLQALSAQSGQVLFTNYTGAPSGSTLTRATGSGTSSITFTATTATASYTVPSPAPLYLRIRAVGAGGGGGGAGTSTANTGGTGGTTFFDGNIITVTGGSGGVGGNASSGGNGGAGGTASVTTSSSVLSLGTFSGQAGTAAVGSSLNTELSGNGGGSAFFGGGGAPAVQSAVGTNGVANSGGGASGGGGISGTTFAGGGGGAGASAQVIITSPTAAATYPYVVGAAGSAGAGSSKNGGSGAAGIIIVEEMYQ